MGRLTLNMLLSFAQFEREVTGERIRDKIAASKQKGMWMGGLVPLGYEPDGRTLRINEAEAETVRTVYRLYIETGNVRRVKVDADCLGLTTKVRLFPDGRMRGGRPLSRGYIYKLLNNPLYAGRIAHKGKTYEGQHPPIIDAGTWDAVQARLAENTHERRTPGRVTASSPLAGKLFDEAGLPLTPSHAVKSERRYRYYVSRHLVTGRTDPTDEKGWRLPAHEIERAIAGSVDDVLADRSNLARIVRESGMPAERIPTLLASVGRWRGKTLDLVERVDIGSGHIALTLNLAPLGDGLETIRYSIPMHIRRRGVEMRLVIEGADKGAQASRPDPALTKAVARAHKWFDDVLSGRASSFAAIAQAEGMSDRYVGRLLPLAFLAPDIVEAILAGNQPVDLTAETLLRRTDLPLAWADQRALLGFA
jgi:hypothetical protein